MTKKEKIWGGLAALHLLLVVAGAMGLSLWEYGRPGALASYYGLVSGSSSTFAFFAPDVGTTLRAEFDVYDSQNHKRATEPLIDSPNREASLRLYDLVEVLTDAIDEPSNRQLLSSSWAGKVFSRHPEAARLVLRIETMDVPTMSEYRDGERYDWEPLYRAEFRRKRIPNG